MLIVSIILVIVMLNGQQKSYYGYMKDSHTIDKMINEQTEKVEKMLNYLLTLM